MNAKQAAELILSCLFLLAGFFLISGGKRATGQARWTPLAATLATPGYYEGELQVTFADSTVQTGYDVFPIVVRAKG